MHSPHPWNPAEADRDRNVERLVRQLEQPDAGLVVRGSRPFIDATAPLPDSRAE
jgi:hypothetical protein